MAKVLKGQVKNGATKKLTIVKATPKFVMKTAAEGLNKAPRSMFDDMAKKSPKFKSPTLTKAKKFKLQQIVEDDDDYINRRQKSYFNKSDMINLSSVMDTNIPKVQNKQPTKSPATVTTSDELKSAKSVKSTKSTKSSSSDKKPPLKMTMGTRSPANPANRIPKTVAERQKAVKCDMKLRRYWKLAVSILPILAIIIFIAFIILVLVFVFSQSHHVTECRILRCSSIAVDDSRTPGRTDVIYDQVAQGKFGYYTKIGIDNNKPCRYKANDSDVSLKGVCRQAECVNTSNHDERHPDGLKFQSNDRTLRLPSFKYFCLLRRTAKFFGFDNSILDMSGEHCPTDENSCNKTIHFYVRASLCKKADNLIKKELQKTNCWGHQRRNEVIFQKIYDPNSNPPILTFTCHSCKKRWDVAKNSLDCQNQTASDADFCRQKGKDSRWSDGKPCCLNETTAIGRCYKGFCWPAL